MNKPQISDFTNYSKDGNVDLLTGKFGIHVPFHEIKTPYLTIPITLSYSTSGVKLDAISNEVGMDWSLYTGGEINRIINDTEDDRYSATDSSTLFAWQGTTNYSSDFLPQEYSFYHPIVGIGGERGAALCSLGSDYINQFPRRHADYDHSLSEIGCLVEIKKFEEWPESDAITGGTSAVKMDTQLDYFKVNAGELNFTFVIKRKDANFFNQGNLNPAYQYENYFEAVPLDDVSVKIELFYTGGMKYNINKYDNVRDNSNSATTITKIQITDKKGIVYVFDKFEYFDYDVIHELKHNWDFGIDGKRVLQYKYYQTNITKWNLTKIILPNSEEINYTYQTSEYVYDNRIPRQHDGEYIGYTYNLRPKMTSYSLSDLDNHHQTNAISEITYGNQKVKFYYSTTRPDYKTGGLNLVKIELRDFNNRLVKTFDLVKEYSYSDNIGGHQDSRMFLKEIIDSQKSKSYKFNYFNSESLPTRGFVEFQDIFGYYIGTQNPYPAFPKLYISPNDTSGNKISYEVPNTGDYFVFNGSDRSVRLNYPKCGAMDKISFPTGGFLKIEYENNTYYDSRLLSKKSLGPGVRVKSLEYYKTEGSLDIKKNYSYDLFQDNQFSSGELIYKPSYAYVSNWSLNNQFNTSSYENLSYDFYDDDGRFAYLVLHDFNQYFTKEKLESQGTSINNILKKMIHVSSHRLGSGQDIFGREIMYKNVSEKIINPQTLASKGEVKYFFKYVDNRGIANSITGPSDEPSVYTAGTIETAYLSFNPFNYFGSNISVKTKSGFIERQGKEIYPFPERNYFDSLENAKFGKLEKVEYYDASNNLVSSTENSYDFLKKNSINNNILKNIKTGYLKAHQYRTNDPLQNFYQIYNGPSLTHHQENRHNFTGLYFFTVNQLQFNSKLVLTSKKTKNYFQGGTSSVEDITNYSYSNQTGNLIQEINIDSNLREKKTGYGYAYSDSDYDWMNTMFIKNIISEPVIVTSHLDSQLVKTFKREYIKDSQGLVFMRSIQHEKGNSLNGEAEERVLFKKYSSKGKLLEASLKDGTNICYIYGYHDSEIVAKLENIAYNSIPASLITTIQTITDSPTATEAQVLVALNALRTSTDVNMQKAMITTYTYNTLIGISSITDPMGDVFTYTYDLSGRLQFVKDKAGKILSENEYNYKP
ncbi:hypothetical protein [Flavobacterium sp.]|uniref:hypothetical protein n=1 Tax=Flavobacterium sp. TaxID=239 RepID=UPI0026396849|nr:hypothetical protein [Flavobacterium sp.]